MGLLRRLIDRATGRTAAAQAKVPAAVDLNAHSFFADPYPVWAWLRANDPAHVLQNGALLLTRHADISAALSDGRLVNRPSRFSAIGPRHRERRTSADVAANILPFMDGDEHRNLRKMLAAAVRASVAASDTLILELATEHAGRFVAAGEGDVLADLVTPYSQMVMTRMFGLPDADGPQLSQWSDAFFRLFSPATSRETLDETDAALAEFRDYLLARLDSAGASQSGSLLLALKTLAADTDAMTKVQAVDAAMLIFADGVENVDALVANAILAMHAEPIWMDRLIADPSLAGAVVEETLRYDAPGQVIARIAASDCEVAGRAVRAEMPVLLALGSANRDDAAWPAAATFDPSRRQSPQHLSFGAGKHGCLGARLVRLEGTAILMELAKASRGIAVTQSGLNWESRFGHRWVEALRVSVSAR